jgi:hypothetical protein
MPLQLSIPEECGVTATYHVVMSGNFIVSPNGDCVVQINSYLDQPTYAAGKIPLATITLDCGPLMAQAAPTPPQGATMQQAVQGIIETYLLTTPTFAGATQVS